ncbi:MAG: TetR/AcrR family transcriptional regulator, partial [Pseudomonadota bacterium]
MFDTTTDKGKLLDAAMALAAERPWDDVSLVDIAERAGISLDALRKSFGSKTQIISAYMRAVDDKVLKERERDDEQTPRDALFETVMARLDAMQPHKDALRSINDDVSPDSTLFRSYLNSQRWMLLAAGIDGDGAR